MRKTSQDGGDCTSITSGVDSDTKKPAGLLKTKKSSIKRKVQNFSHESDDAVIEPLLQKDKDKSDMPNLSAKHLLSKAKTESLSEVINDKDKLLPDKKNEKSLTSAHNVVAGASSFINGTKENHYWKSYENSAITVHNHMNTNVFSSFDGGKSIILPKSQILVEIDGGKQPSYNPSPLIFTTAKIHSDGKTKHMEPVQVTPVPILSTIEGSFIKSGNICDNNKPLSSAPNKGDTLNAIYVMPSAIDSIVDNEKQHAKIIPAYSNVSYSGIPTRLPEPDENIEQTASNQHSLPSSNSANDLLRSIITVDVNITLPAKTIKSDIGVTGNSFRKTVDICDINKNGHESKNASLKKTFMGNGNKIDMNKNLQPLCTSSLGQVSSDKVVSDKKIFTDVSSIKQLQRQKQTVVEDSNKDVADSFASDKLNKDRIESSHQKIQQTLGANKSVVDVNKPLTTFKNNITAASDFISNVGLDSQAVNTTSVTLSSHIETKAVLPVLMPLSCKSLEVTVNPLSKTTLTTTTTSGTNKSLSSTISLLAKTTASSSMSTGKSASTKTSSSINQVTSGILTTNTKKVTEVIGSNPLSSTSMSIKSSATIAVPTAKPIVTCISTICATKPTVLTTTVTSTTKPVVIIPSSVAEHSVTTSKPIVIPAESSSGHKVETTRTLSNIILQTTTTMLSSLPKSLVTTVKSPSNTKMSAKPTKSVGKPIIAMNLPTGYPTVTKSSTTDLKTKPEKSKSINTAQSTTKNVKDLTSSTNKPVKITSSTADQNPMVKTQESSNPSTLLKSSKNSVSKPTTGTVSHSATTLSSKSAVTSTSSPSTTTNSVKQASVKSTTSKLKK